MSGEGTTFYNELGPWAVLGTVAESLGRSSEMIASMCERGELLGVDFDGQLLFPVQQFRNGTPIEGLSRVVSVLRCACSPMEIATMLANPVYIDSDLTFWAVLRAGEVERMSEWAGRTVARLDAP